MMMMTKPNCCSKDKGWATAKTITTTTTTMKMTMSTTTKTTTATVMMMTKPKCCSKDKGWATVRSRRGVIRTRGGKLRQWVGATPSQYQFQLPPALTIGRRFSLRAKVIQFWFEFGMFDNCNKKVFSLQAADWAQFRCKRFWEQYWSHQENLASTALRPTIGRLGRQYKHI